MRPVPATVKHYSRALSAEGGRRAPSGRADAASGASSAPFNIPPSCGGPETDTRDSPAHMSQPFTALVAQWRAQADHYEQDGVSGHAALLRRVAAELYEATTRSEEHTSELQSP